MPVSPDSSGETGLSGAASEINVDDSASKLSFSLRGDGTPTPDFDGASMCSSPSSVKVSMRNTFLHFREDAEIQIQDLDSPRSELAGCPSPLRRSQSDVTEMNDYLRHRFGSGTPPNSVEVDESFTPEGCLSPMSQLASGPGARSILSFSPPQSFAASFNDAPSDFVMVMEEDPSPPRTRNSPIVTPTHEDIKTTVMLRNIPNKYTQKMLLDVINESGFSGKYNFFYLPIDFRNKYVCLHAISHVQ